MWLPLQLRFSSSGVCYVVFPLFSPPPVEPRCSSWVDDRHSGSLVDLRQGREHSPWIQKSEFTGRIFHRLLFFLVQFSFPHDHGLSALVLQSNRSGLCAKGSRVTSHVAAFLSQSFKVHVPQWTGWSVPTVNDCPLHECLSATSKNETKWGSVDLSSGQTF